MEPFQKGHLSYRVIKSWEEKFPNLTAGITTRHGGTSSEPYDTLNMGLHVHDDGNAVVDNRQRLAGLIQFPLEAWVLGEQVHGTKIMKVEEESPFIGAGTTPEQPAIAGIDGLITKNKDILLAAFFADCVPLYFYDPKTGWFGIAHAGWKGTVGGIAGEMVKKLICEGVSAKDLYVAIGPSIGANNYQVNQQVIDQIPKCFQAAVCVKLDLESDQYLLDLKKLNQLMLIDQAVDQEKIIVSKQCTYEQPHFYSHRRDQGQTGRMLGFIGCR